jgi:DNA invertase Pin-like site-specific DNA recombinase
MMHNSASERYFLYARKSTDTEDKQVRSIEDQLAELREFAKTNHLSIVETFVEKQTAKVPGRPIFNELIKRIEQRHASGIIAWHPNRLSRNSVDTGYLVYMMDQDVLLEIRTPGQSFKNTPNDKFLLNLLCSQAKLENDNKAIDVKRAMRQKAKDGIYPLRAPVGYLNDPLTRKIAVDPKTAPMIREMFERYAGGTSTLRDLKAIFDPKGLRSKSGTLIGLSGYQHILCNAFYHGIFCFADETYEGKHEPLVPKSLFDRVQATMRDRGKPRRTRREPRLYQAMFRCGECGCAITAEIQKGYTYLRCTKKKGTCRQPFLREENAIENVKRVIAEVAMPKHWIDWLEESFQSRRIEEQLHLQEQRDDLRATINAAQQRLDRLTRLYIDNMLSLHEYQRTKAQLIDEKTDAKEKLRAFDSNPTEWLERADTFISRLKEAVSIASTGNPEQQRDFLKEIGSNLKIRDGKIDYEFQPLWKHVVTERRNGKLSRGASATTRRAMRGISSHVPSPGRKSSASTNITGFECILKDKLVALDSLHTLARSRRYSGAQTSL